METAKKNWEAPLILNIDGSKVESGSAPIPEGMHMSGSPTGSSFFPS
jgi:hypothetical protein